MVVCVYRARIMSFARQCGVLRERTRAYYGSGNTGWNNAYAAQADPHFGKPYYHVRAAAGISPYYGYSGWEDYSGRNFLKCVPGTMTKLDDGQMYRCQ